MSEFNLNSHFSGHASICSLTFNKHPLTLKNYFLSILASSNSFLEDKETDTNGIQQGDITIIKIKIQNLAQTITPIKVNTELY